MVRHQPLRKFTQLTHKPFMKRLWGKEQALIAVCNKLVKQVFAVVKNNTLYQPNYCSARP